MTQEAIRVAITHKSHVTMEDLEVHAPRVAPLLSFLCPSGVNEGGVESDERREEDDSGRQCLVHQDHVLGHEGSGLHTSEI